MPAGSTPPRRERHPRDVLSKHGIRPRRATGQRFLVSGKDLDRVVEAACIGPDEAVLEIGTGLGRLSARIAARAGHLVTVEIDDRLHRVAAEHLGDLPNVTLLRCDFLASKHRINPAVAEAVRSALGGLAGPLKVVSNLPYNISSPAVVALLEWDIAVGEMFLMFQKEVADRLAASPGVKEYGPLTVCVDYWATVERLFSLPRRAFWPVPEVSSVLVRIVKRAERRRTEQYDAFSAVVRKLFEGRRKTLRRSLRSGWGDEKAAQVIERLGLDPRRRADTLSTEDFEAIAAVTGPPQRG